MELVSGFLQAYDWGPTDGLTPWTEPTGGPQAELWFGSHANGPSPQLNGDGAAQSKLSILTKILAAARPLSIQIHPPVELAQEMYETQAADPHTQALVSDPYGKAELLIAFEPFVILEGFRDPSVSAQAFSLMGPAMQPVAEALGDADIPAAITMLLTMTEDDVRHNATQLPTAFARAGMSQHTVDTITEVVDAFPADPGVFVAALLNARTLQPGQAVFVDPGTVHAYVRGLGLEVMTNSDNVLRLGLTSKTIAVKAALAALDVKAQPHPCDPEDVGGVRTYAPPGAPFTVEVLRDAHTTAQTGHARIVVCLMGLVAVGDKTLELGEGALLEAGEPDVAVSVDGVAIVAHHADTQ
jgi:mannose-6-phosphate isomerase